MKTPKYLNNRKNNYLLTLNTTGEYILPESKGFKLIQSIETEDGTLHLYQVDPQIRWNSYIEDILFPYLINIYNRFHGDDDHFDYLPSLKDEVSELLYQIPLEPEEYDTLEIWLKRLDEILPDPE